MYTHVFFMCMYVRMYVCMCMYHSMHTDFMHAKIYVSVSVYSSIMCSRNMTEIKHPILDKHAHNTRTHAHTHTHTYYPAIWLERTIDPAAT